MHQSIAILQMSNTELLESAINELNKNPFIEDDNVKVESKDYSKKKLDEAYHKSQSFYSGNYSSQDFLSNIAKDKSLKGHISEQINLSFNDDKDRLVAYYLLDLLSPSGYLDVNVSEISLNLMCDELMVLQVIKTLQTFDPIGIFARNVQECLTMQLEERGEISDSLQVMVQNLDLLAKGELKKLSNICKADIEATKHMIKRIKQLNPKPANGFFIEQTKYKIPDVILTFEEDGIAKLEVNSEAMPRLHVNREYYLKIKDTVQDNEERNFTKRELDSANTICNAIEQRSNTILKVASAIVEEQADFFTRGILHLKPMTLNKIAAMTEFNESTVSRSTAHKYIATPSGIFELKYFFSSSLGSARSTGSDVSSTKVKEIIKQMILSEDADNVLSDDEISKQLSSFNISIARRTVAKYRESIGVALLP